MNKGAKRSLRIDPHIIGILAIFVVFFAAMCATQGQRFLRVSIFKSMMYQFPEYGLLSFGVMLALISGGNDLSTVGVANLTGILSAMLLARAPADISGVQAGLLIAGIALFALLIGSVCGCFTALLIYKVKIPAFVASIGTLKLYTGIGMGLTEGQAISGLPHVYTNMIQHNFFKLIPMPLLVYIVCAIFMAYITRRSSFGLQLKLQGSNANAARFAGIRKSEVLIKAYVISGCMAALAGLIMIGRMNSAKSDYGTSYTLLSILICILGGVSPKGGSGKISGVIFSVITLQMVTSGMALFRQINTFYNMIFFGALLLIALIFDYYYEKIHTKKMAAKG